MKDFPDRERRGRPRIEQPFPATVRGVDATGESLDIDTVVDNMSSRGLFVRVPRPIEPGARLAIGVRVGMPGAQERSARIAARGVVVRVELMPKGEYGLGVALTRHRIF